MTDKDAERRRYPRHPCDRTFEGNFPETPSGVFRCHAVNASEGGLMLETDRALEVGQKIELSLRSRDRRRSVVAEAEVQWCTPCGEMFRAGVQFLNRREDYVI